jgi:hypothetical protein
MKSNRNALMSLLVICVSIFLQIIPAVTLAQYNSAKKNTNYLLPQQPVVLTARATDELKDSLARQRKYPLRYLDRSAANSLKTNISFMFRQNRKPSMESIERAIVYQRSVKQKLDLSFLATMGYSLFSHGQLYMPQNDANMSTIKK